jgi:hypothetical protein
MEPDILPPFWAQIVSEVNRLSGNSMRPVAGSGGRNRRKRGTGSYRVEVAESIDFFAGDHIISGRQQYRPGWLRRSFASVGELSH